MLTKTGCNSAACHGAAIGRGGLRLSLLGYDPDSDFERFLLEYRGRRVNQHDVDRSLLLKKVSRQIRHGGGKRLAQDSEGYRILREWIASGAKIDANRRIEKLEISPRQMLLDEIGDSFRLKVVANFSDGTKEDVTRWTVFESNDKQALKCDKVGEVSALRRGQSSVMVRFLGQVDSVIVTVPLEQPSVTKTPARFNFIDDFVNETLSRLHMDSSPQADDSTFLRRVYLDLTGTLPSPPQRMEFLADTKENKRLRLVDRLLKSNAFADHWSYKWGDVFQIESKRLGQGGVSAFHQWLKTQISENTPYDQMVRRLLLSEGDANKVGEANFHRVPNNAREQAEYVSRVFLGVRLQCANCHNHPLDRWTQDDYHGLAAVFARVQREQVVKIGDRGEVIHPKTKRPIQPRIPGERFIDTSADPRIELADWITSSDNPFLARAAVNRAWRDLMGRGLVEAIDDHRASNPATHPELLDQLAAGFIESGFDIRKLIKTIVSSAAYQRSSLSTGNNRADDRFYAKSIVRRLSPIAIVDAVSSVTGVSEEFGAMPLGTKAIQLADSRVRSKPLDLLGRCDRAGGCVELENEGSSSLPLTLHVINGDWINAKLEHTNGNLNRFLQLELSNEQFVTKIFILAYSREPTPEESSHWAAKLSEASGGQRIEVLKDFTWAVLNSTEFCSNH